MKIIEQADRNHYHKEKRRVDEKVEKEEAVEGF